MKSVIIIGSGIGGLALAALLGKRGYTVTVVEKNEQLGGRASVLEAKGFRFDMGPSWYLMPDIFEHYFTLMGERVEDYLDLIKLDPSYRIFVKRTGEIIDMHAGRIENKTLFERFEPGSYARFTQYLDEAKRIYDLSKQFFIYRNYDSLRDMVSRDLMAQRPSPRLFASLHAYVSRVVKDDTLQKILEYQLVFLGNSPYNAPALYMLMNHIDFDLGVFYPQGGMGKIVEALVTIGKKHSVTYRVDAPVQRIEVQDYQARGVTLASGESIAADMVVSNADMWHTDTQLLGEHASRDKTYWEKRVMAPSAFILYLGVRGSIPSLIHHNLLFSHDWKQSFAEIFDAPQWPSDPSLYVCVPSKTDASVAPDGYENVFVLIPTACDLRATDEQLHAFEDRILETIETHMNAKNLCENIIFKQRFWGKDFAQRYESFRGSALGLAHTLMQSAVWRPNNTHPTISNLFFVGAGTNPGIGVPMCLISAQNTYKRIVGDTSVGPLQIEEESA